MLFFKSTNCYAITKLFNNFGRFNSRLPYLSNCLFKQHQIVNSRHIVHNNKKSNTISRGDIAVSQTFISFKYLRLIKNAVREFGPIIKNNQKLSYILQGAKKHKLSQEYIDHAIRMSCDTRAKFGLFDLLLSNGCHLVIQYEDIDSTNTKHHCLKLCNIYDGMLCIGEVKWPNTYDQKGIITVRCQKSDPLSNQPKEIFSKIGVTSFHKEVDIDHIEYWKFYCEPWQLHDVKKHIFGITNNIEEVFVGYVPRETVDLSSHNFKNYVCNIFIELGKVPCIDNVYHNTNLIK